MSGLPCFVPVVFVVAVSAVSAACEPTTTSEASTTMTSDAAASDATGSGDTTGGLETTATPDAIIESDQGASDGGNAEDGSVDAGPSKDAATPACVQDDDCPQGQWCRATVNGESQACVPYVGAGETCGGLISPWLVEQCVPELSCLSDPDLDGVTGICGTCWAEGAVYQAGDSFDAADGCNTCQCLEDGSVPCTKVACAGCSTDDDCDDGSWCRATEDGGNACVPFVGAGETCGGYTPAWAYEKCEPGLSCVSDPATDDLPGVCGACWYEGTVYQAGDSFDAVDGCNTCGCADDGSVTCTKIGCPPLCPDGSAPVQCAVDPCSVSTCKDTDATCTPNYCGGCFAEWTNSVGEAVCNGCSSNEDCPSDQWCRQADESGDLECVPYATEGESCGGFTLPWFFEQCLPTLSCLSDPNSMIADLPGVCGSCWYGGQVRQAGEVFDAGDDCNTCQCDADGSVACTEKACVGCTSDKDCDNTSWCRPTQEGSNSCVPYVGADETCGGYTVAWAVEKCEPGLSCVGNPMIPDLPGTCGACWYEGDVYQAGDSFDAADGCNTCTCGEGGEVGCTKIACPPLCADGSAPVQCFANPCDTDICDVKDATCTPNYCGGCFAEWTTPSGEAVCNSCTTNADCPSDQWCRQTEDASVLECVPYAVEGESCGGFTLPWFYEQCLPTLSCLSDPNSLIADLPGECGACWYDGQVRQQGDIFDATDGCNTCQCDDSGGATCTEKVCDGGCPDGSEPVSCFVDPCDVSVCDVVGATCTPNYCGGCFAVWTTPDGQEVCNL